MQVQAYSNDEHLNPGSHTGDSFFSVDEHDSAHKRTHVQHGQDLPRDLYVHLMSLSARTDTPQEFLRFLRCLRRLTPTSRHVALHHSLPFITTALVHYLPHNTASRLLQAQTDLSEAHCKHTAKEQRTAAKEILASARAGAIRYLVSFVVCALCKVETCYPETGNGVQIVLNDQHNGEGTSFNGVPVQWVAGVGPQKMLFVCANCDQRLTYVRASKDGLGEETCRRYCLPSTLAHTGIADITRFVVRRTDFCTRPSRHAVLERDIILFVSKHYSHYPLNIEKQMARREVEIIRRTHLNPCWMKDEETLRLAEVRGLFAVVSVAFECTEEHTHKHPLSYRYVRGCDDSFLDDVAWEIFDVYPVPPLQPPSHSLPRDHSQATEHTLVVSVLGGSIPLVAVREQVEAQTSNKGVCARCWKLQPMGPRAVRFVPTSKHLLIPPAPGHTPPAFPFGTFELCDGCVLSEPIGLHPPTAADVARVGVLRHHRFGKFEKLQAFACLPHSEKSTQGRPCVFMVQDLNDMFRSHFAESMRGMRKARRKWELGVEAINQDGDEERQDMRMGLVERVARECGLGAEVQFAYQFGLVDSYVRGEDHVYLSDVEALLRHNCALIGVAGARN